MRMPASLLLVLALALPAAAQQKLGEVAGSIKLKKPEGESVVIDDTGISRSAARTPSGDLAADLVDVTVQALEAGEEISAYIAGLPWVSPVIYDSSASEILQNADAELELAASSLPLFAGLESYDAAIDDAAEGVGALREAISAARDAVSRYRVVSREVREQAARGVGMLRVAVDAMESVERGSARESTPAPIDPIAADAAIRAGCGRRYSPESEAYGECYEEHQAALDRLVLRSGAAAGVTTAAFNRIRNECAFEWSGDYVARDRCEQRRLAAAGGR